MTNPTLERAERAVEDATFNELMPGQALIVARAVLMAVREPDEAMVEAYETDEEWFDHPVECYLNLKRYTAMIDAILNDEEGE